MVLSHHYPHYNRYCADTKNLFAKVYPKFKVIELDTTDDGDKMHEELKKMTNHRTVPNVWVNQKFIGGNDDTVKIYKSGELEKMLRET